ncbi:MAG: hypothetical protein RBU29_02940 [bacterium]|jgi:hypothetical protein|nr:hypothetical protein [bacterium]
MTGYDDKTLSQINTALKAAQIMEKAKEGVPLNEIVIDQKGGKSKAVTQKEKQASDSIRRKQVLDQLKRRTLPGESTLAADLSTRIQRCLSLLTYIRVTAPLPDSKVLTIQRNLESTYNKAASLLKEIEVLEGALDRKKKDDPVIVEYEQKSKELFKAMQDKNMALVTELRKFCEQNVANYNLHKKRLTPYVLKAREVRVKFIEEKRRVMRVQFEMFAQFTETVAKDLLTGTLAHLDEETKIGIQGFTLLIREKRTQAQPSYELLGKPFRTNSVAGITEAESDMDHFDSFFLAPMSEDIDHLMASINTVSHSQRTDPTAKKTDKASSSRMAFQQKQENT